MSQPQGSASTSSLMNVGVPQLSSQTSQTSQTQGSQASLSQAPLPPPPLQSRSGSYQVWNEGLLPRSPHFQSSAVYVSPSKTGKSFFHPSSISSSLSLFSLSCLIIFCFVLFCFVLFVCLQTKSLVEWTLWWRIPFEWPCWRIVLPRSLPLCDSSSSRSSSGNIKSSNNYLNKNGGDDDEAWQS